MKKFPSLFAFIFLVISINLQAQSIDGYFRSGIPTDSIPGANPYVAAGNRAYLIGSQDGLFPDMGGHIKGEMAGLWLPPIKIIDGFWAQVTDLSSGEKTWLDKPSRFINYPYGNAMEYAIAGDKIEITRSQFCPDGQPGLIVDYQFSNKTRQEKKISFELAVKTDISPVWLAKRLKIFDTPDTLIAWDAQQQLFKAQDSLHPWYAAWGATEKSQKQFSGQDVDMPQPTIGKGIKTAATYSISIPANGTRTIRFVFAGSDQAMEKAVATASFLRSNAAKLLKEKKERYRTLLTQGRISIPDKPLQRVYDWVKINTDWLVRTVPEIGTGLSAGYMDYPWWFGCDNTYALQAVMAMGNSELARQTLRLLKNVSEKTNGDGRIVHEISTNGVVFNKGNTQETDHFIMCVGTYFQYTGDTAFIREMYPYLEKGINWLLVTQDQNKDMFPEGYGIMEMTGLNAELIDVAVYTEQALESMAMLSKVMGNDAAESKYQQLARTLKEKINRAFWDEQQHSYCEFFGTKQQAVTACLGAAKQISLMTHPDAKAQKARAYYEDLAKKIDSLPDQTKGWLTSKNWVINTPMETGIAPREKAIAALDIIRNENCGPYGPYLAAVEKRHMMTIATGVQAVAECRYGRMDEALWYVDRIVSTFNRVLPGSMSEMMPDYGCFTQAWTNYGVVLPLVKYMFGITPDALQKRISIAPHFPSGWDSVSIDDLQIGDDIISYRRQKSVHSVKYVFTRKKGNWALYFYADQEPGRQYYLNGQLLKNKTGAIALSGTRNELLIKP